VSTRLLRQEAEKDLEDIFSYTLENFGPQQADRYYDAILDMFARILAEPQLGRPVSQRHPGILKQSCREHFVIFARGEDGIDVIRVLHQRMDIDSHLG
jgi:toxin ParE1/3/4